VEQGPFANRARPPVGRVGSLDGAVVLYDDAREVGNNCFAASASAEERPSDQAPSNFAVEQTAGSHSLAAAAHRDRWTHIESDR